MKDPTLFAPGDKRGPLPLMVGITGHRDLRADDRVSLRKCLSGIFRQLKRHYPQTPIVLLSALAEGADCLAAEVALPLGIRLLVPLPMPADEYRADFKTAESQQEFDHLLQQAEHVFDVGFAEGNTLKLVRESAPIHAALPHGTGPPTPPLASPPVYFYKAGHNAKEKRILKEFRNMKEIFDEAYPVLSRGSLQDQATHLQKLGARALQENGDWVQLYISLPEEDVAADG
jgi:hypothetical protein